MPFSSHEQKLLALSYAYEQALSHHEKVKNRYSLWGRVKDALTTTPEEQYILDAQQHLNEYKEKVRHDVCLWLDQQITLSTSNNPSWQTLKHRMDQWTLRSGRVKERLTLGKETLDAVEVASHICSSASSTAMLDAFTNNMAVSYLSHHETDNAKQALEEASKAVQRFQDVVKHESFAQDLTNTGIENSLGWTMALSSSFNWFAFANIGKLSDAAEQCEKVYKSIKLVVDELQKHYDKIEQERHKVSQQYQKTITPFLKTLLQGFPSEILKVMSEEGDALFSSMNSYSLAQQVMSNHNFWGTAIFNTTSNIVEDVLLSNHGGLTTPRHKHL